MSEPTMLLCVGLHSKDRLATLAPRLVGEDGTIVVAAGMDRGPAGDYRPSTLAQRVTYLAQVLGAGLYDAEVVTEPAGVEVPIVYPIPVSEVPAWARDLFDEKRWTSPTVRAR